jgi:predicted patatin/cPLA2 family phospholipase
MIQQTTPKLAIVCAAGGTSCSYSGGALCALAKEHGLLQPDYLIAASGSAGSAMYYLTGQYESIHRIWTQHICSPKFLSFWRIHKMMDVDYLVDTIIREKEPLHLRKLAATQTRYFIPVKNAATGMGHYISCRDKLEIHEVLRATKALPFFYGRKIRLGDEAYVDSALVITKEHGVSKAIELGATHILVLEINSRKKNLLQSLAEKITSMLSLKNINHHVASNEVNILRLGPDKNPAPPVSRNASRLSAAFDKGYTDVRDHMELRDFLKSFVGSGG